MNIKIICCVIIFVNFFCLGQDKINANTFNDLPWLNYKKYNNLKIKTNNKKFLLNIFKKAKENNKDYFIVNSSIELSFLYTKEFNIDSALFYEKEIRRITQKKEYYFNEHILNNTAIVSVFMLKKDFDSAFYYLQESNLMVETRKQINSDVFIKHKLKQQQFLFYMCEYEEALLALDSAYSYVIKTNSNTFLPLIYSSYGNIFYEIKQYKKSIFFLKKSIDEKQSSGDSPYYYLSLINAYQDDNSSDSAVYYTRLALELAHKKKNKLLENVYKLTLINLLYNSNTLEASQCFYSIDKKYLNGELFCIYFFSKSKISKYNKDKIYYSEKALDCTNDLELKKDIYKYLYECTKKSKNPKALQYLEYYNKYNDSINKNHKETKIEKAILYNKIKTQNTKLKYKHSQYNLVKLFFTLLIIILIILFFFIYKKQAKRKISLLEERNQLNKAVNKTEKDLMNSLFEIENNIKIIEKSKDTLFEIKNSTTISNNNLNTLYVNLNQYLIKINKNKELKNKIDNFKGDFFKKIEAKTKFTNTEKKLIILIRLGMSSKEIAELLNVSKQTIEKYRYRLRKKLFLDRNDSLLNYIKSL